MLRPWTRRCSTCSSARTDYGVRQDSFCALLASAGMRGGPHARPCSQPSSGRGRRDSLADRPRSGRRVGATRTSCDSSTLASRAAMRAPRSIPESRARGVPRRCVYRAERRLVEGPSACSRPDRLEPHDCRSRPGARPSDRDRLPARARHHPPPPPPPQQPRRPHARGGEAAQPSRCAADRERRGVKLPGLEELAKPGGSWSRSLRSSRSRRGLDDQLRSRASRYGPSRAVLPARLCRFESQACGTPGGIRKRKPVEARRRRPPTPRRRASRPHADGAVIGQGRTDRKTLARRPRTRIARGAPRRAAIELKEARRTGSPSRVRVAARSCRPSGSVATSRLSVTIAAFGAVLAGSGGRGSIALAS